MTAEYARKIPADPLLTPCQAARALPGQGHHQSKVIRWILSGLLVGGRRRRLAATRVGGRWLIDTRDLAAFLSAVAGDRGQPVDEECLRSETFRTREHNRRRQHRAARAVLESAGIL